MSNSNFLFCRKLSRIQKIFFDFQHKIARKIQFTVLDQIEFEDISNLFRTDSILKSFYYDIALVISQNKTLSNKIITDINGNETLHKELLMKKQPWKYFESILEEMSLQIERQECKDLCLNRAMKITRQFLAIKAAYDKIYKTSAGQYLAYFSTYGYPVFDALLQPYHSINRITRLEKDLQEVFDDMTYFLSNSNIQNVSILDFAAFGNRFELENIIGGWVC